MESPADLMLRIIGQVLAAKTIPGFVYGVTNLDEEIYFHGGGPNVVGDPSSGEIGPDSIMCLCSQTKLITALAVSSSSRLNVSFPELIQLDLVNWLP